MAFRKFSKKRAAGPRRVSRKKKVFRKKPKTSLRRSKKMSPAANVTTIVEGFEQGNIAFNTVLNYAFTPDVGAGTVAWPWANPTSTGSINMASSFPRFAVAMAQYRYFRVTAVECKYEPEANTFQAGAGAVPTIPKFWMRMDKTGQFQDTTLAQIIDAGVKPKPFTRPKTVKYTPVVPLAITSGVPGIFPGNGAVTVTPTTGAAITMYKKNNWMSTIGNASATSGLPVIPFCGHQVFIEAESVTPGQLGPKVTIMIRAEFKQPLL